MKKTSGVFLLLAATLAACSGPGNASSNSAASSASSSSAASSSQSSSSQEAKELITNGDFSTGGIAPFVKNDFEGAASTAEVTNKMLKLSITAVSWGQASPRIEYSNLKLQDKKTYLLSFDAYAETARTMHIQVGQLLSADPWFSAASSKAVYLDLGTAKKTFRWTFAVDASLGSDLTQESLLMEFGKMTNGAPSVATNVYLGSISLKETATPLPDTTAPILTVSDKSYFFVGDTFVPTDYVSVRDDIDANIKATVDAAKSTLPTVDANNAITGAPGNYSAAFTATDSSGNIGTATWNFEVRAKVEVVNNFNLDGFVKGNSLNDIPDGDTTKGIVYAADAGTAFSFADKKLTITSVQDPDKDDWTATQVFARSVRVDKGGEYELSFDINSSVDGVIQVSSNWVDGIGYPIVKGDNHISLEKSIYDGNYADLTIVFGTHVSVQQPGKNIGAFTATISNFSFVSSSSLPDVEAPIIKLNTIKNYFVGDVLDVMKSVTITDYRDPSPKLEIVTAESTMPVVDAKNILTTAGNYKVVFKGTDASGNSRKFAAYYLVKDKPVGVNNFAFETFVYGEEWMLNDPTEPYLWNDAGVNVTRTVNSKTSLSFSTDQKAADAWYATQLFFMSLKVDTFGLYKLTYSIVSDVTGVIKVDGSALTLKVGANAVEKTFALEAGGYYHASVQFGKEESGNIGACHITVQDLALVYQPQPANPTWSGSGMTVSQSGTDAVITYASIPDPFYTINARIYDFTDKSQIQAISVDFTGTKGQTYQFKIEGLTSDVFASISVKATGDEQKTVIDTTNMTLEQKQSLNCLLMFVETVGASGSCTIHSYKFYNNIEDAFDTKWRGYGTTVVEKDGVSTITFDSVSDSWWNESAQHSIDSGNVTSATTKIIFTFKGEKGTLFLFKAQGNGQQVVDENNPTVATGDVQDFALDITSVDAANRTDLNLLVVFCKTVGYSGSIVISNIKYQ